MSHNPAQRPIGIALFGRRGIQRCRVAATTAIAGDLIRSAEERFGILVLPAV